MPTWGGILQELQATPATPGGPSPLDVVRRKYLKQLADHTKRNVILYASKWTQGGADPDLVSLNAEDMQGFMEVVHGLSSAAGLDLVLHSPGGSAEATEAIVKYLRSKFTDIRVVVPHAAMSAATMLACSANSVVMGKHSFLGPIDPQLITQTDGVRRAVAAHAIIEQFRLAQKECRDPTLLPSWLPILRQYGPALIVQCQFQIDLSKKLVSEWLAKYMFAGSANANEKAADTANKLADHGEFKSHGRFLSREEVKGLNIVVSDLESDQAFQDAVLSTFHAATHTMSATPTAKIIENHLGKAFIKTQITLPTFFPQMIPQMIPSGPPAAPPPVMPPPGPP
jgi:hypothetical protein